MAEPIEGKFSKVCHSIWGKCRPFDKQKDWALNEAAVNKDKAAQRRQRLTSEADILVMQSVVKL